MSSETLIFDTIVATIPIDATQLQTAGAAAPPSEHEKVEALLRRICDPHREQTFIICGRAFDVLHAGPGNPSTGTTFKPRDNAGCEAHIVLCPPDKPAQRVNIRVTLAGGRANITTSWLTIELNPTTLIAGNNVLPATLADSESEETPSSFSSHGPTAHRFFRLGFRLLEELHRQARNAREPLFSERTRDAIRRGDIRIARCQWAAYLPTADVRRFLQIIALLHGQIIAQGDGVVTLAAHRGLAFDMFTDDHNEVTGVMLRKRHGKKQLFSIVFYDKRARVAQMHQGKTLTPVEQTTVDEHVRLDVTAHALGIMTLVDEARRKLKRLIARSGAKHWPIWRDAFLVDEPEPTVWWLQRAIWILSHFSTKSGVTRKSFARWLVPYAVRDILSLHVVAGFKSDDFHRLLADEDKVAAAWRSAEYGGSGNWAKRLAGVARVSPATVYTRRDQFLAKFGIDIALPHAFYSDLLFFGSNSAMQPRARSALLEAQRGRDGEAIVRQLEAAAANFDRARREIVGPTVASLPLALPVRVAAAPLSAPTMLAGGSADVPRLAAANTRAAAPSPTSAQTAPSQERRNASHARPGSSDIRGARRGRKS